MSIGKAEHKVSCKRGSLRRAIPVSVAFAALLFCVSLAGNGQSAGVNQGGPEYVHAPAGLDPMRDPGKSEAASQVDQMRQAERQRRVAADTARLVQLSNELKAEIDQASKDQLSVNAVRTAAEIEKVAHDLRGWLKS